MAVLISSFSTHYFSSQHTSRIITPILHWLFPRATTHSIHLMHVAIRKLAHVTEFAIFSVTVFHGIRGRLTGWRLSWALGTLAIAVTYAGLDEWHQSFVPLRESTVRDVLLDAFGALLAQSLVWIYSRSKWNFAVPQEATIDAAKK
ncbi:MAG TPA: VanZ family protein [Candidatus Acidoferrum sp.]